jgi:glycosyltransferase involved in cell wall biosynthesis
MKILQVSNGIAPYSCAGTELYTARLSGALAGLGLDVDVAVPEPRRPVAVRPRGVGAAPRVHFIQRAPAKWYGNKPRRLALQGPLWKDGLRDLAHAVGPDVIHVHHVGGFGVSALGVLGRLGLPMVVTLADYWLLCPGTQRRCGGDLRACATGCFDGRWAASVVPGLAMTYLAARRRAVRRFIDHARPTLAAISESTRATFECEGFPADLLVNRPWGIVSSGTRPANADRFEGSNRPRIGYLGTLRPHKGCHVLIDAFRRLDRPGSLHILGHGDPSYIGALRERAVGLDVHFHGRYENEDVGEVLEGLDLIVIPSVWEETYCLVFQEAMAARRPVIATRVGGLADRVVDGVNGFLVPPDNVEAMASRLAEVLGNLDRVRSTLDYDRAALGLDEDARCWIELYREAVERRRPGLRRTP